MRLTLLLALLCLCLPAIARAHESTPLRGTLVERHLDGIDGTEPEVNYSLETASGIVPLADDQRAELVGQRVEITDQSEASGVQGQAAAQSSTRLASPTDPGPHKTAVVLINFTDNRNQPTTQDEIRSTVFTGSSSVNQFYQKQSGGGVSLVGRDRADGDVYGWYQLPIASTGCNINAYAASAQSAASAAGADLSGYDHIIYYYPTVSACTFSGAAELPGSRVWINGRYDGSFERSNIAHELGHNMGANHAASMACTSNGAAVAISDSCNVVDYGDPFDVMGQGPRLMSSWHRAQLGQLPAANQQTVTSSGSYSLSTVNDFAAPTKKLIVVPRKRAGSPTTQFYALEIRSPLSPFDNFAASDRPVTGVTVRLVPLLTSRTQSRLVDTTPSTATNFDAPLQSGQTFTDEAYGITIQNTGSSTGAASLSITVPVIPDTTPPSAPTRLTATQAGQPVHLQWGASSDDEAFGHYDIFRNNTLIASTTATSFDDTAYAGNNVGTYRIDAVDVAGNRASSGETTITFPDTVAPGSPNNLSATRSSTGVSLSWAGANDNRGIAKTGVSILVP